MIVPFLLCAIFCACISLFTRAFVRYVKAMQSWADNVDQRIDRLEQFISGDNK